MVLCRPIWIVDLTCSLPDNITPRLRLGLFLMTCVQCGLTDGRTKSNRKTCNRCNALWRDYKITHADYEEMLEKQNYRCAICKSNNTKSNRKKRFAVDHDHKTGEVRGLLCDCCNRGIGLLEDSITNLENAIKYLNNEHIVSNGD